MKGNMMILAPLWLLLCWMSPEGSMAADPLIQLTMEEDSVDDMYFGCREKMWKLVQEQYFENEKKLISWDDIKIKDCPEKQVTGLTEEHKNAICIYTGNMYKELNPAVRTEKKNYGSSFKFHSLHFLLTSAIQILNPDYSCYNVFRRIKAEVTNKVKVDDIIRFGGFASSSTQTHLIEFGSKTCFQIKTCLGARLKDYSGMKHETEVLIPPYEMFKITEIHDGKRKCILLDDCKKVFVLESAGVKSNLNCKVVFQKSQNDKLFGRH